VESNLKRLLDAYRQDTRLTQLADALQGDTPARLQLNGLVGAQEAFVLAAALQRGLPHHLVVANNKEEAAYLQNDLANLMDTKPVPFFPDSFKRPQQFAELNNNQVQQRTEVINKITRAGEGGQIVVTYPEALFEKVVDPAVIEANRIEIVKGEALDVDGMIDILLEYGFFREDFVYEPGQFSIRGGIIDIFSLRAGGPAFAR
jgi:transcription-repair coupling factor (superfamily II helicase)